MLGLFLGPGIQSLEIKEQFGELGIIAIYLIKMQELFDGTGATS